MIEVELLTHLQLLKLVLITYRNMSTKTLLNMMSQNVHFLFVVAVAGGHSTQRCLT